MKGLGTLVDHMVIDSKCPQACPAQQGQADLGFSDPAALPVNHPIAMPTQCAQLLPVTDNCPLIEANSLWHCRSASVTMHDICHSWYRDAAIRTVQSSAFFRLDDINRA